MFSGFGVKPSASGFQSYSYSSLKTSPSVTSRVVPSVYLASVCWPLQCLISTLTQGGGGGHFFKAHLFSRVVGREEHCKQISLVCVGSAHSVSASLGLLLLTVCVLSLSTLLRL